jgi:hypothetical protein
MGEMDVFEKVSEIIASIIDDKRDELESLCRDSEILEVTVGDLNIYVEGEKQQVTFSLHKLFDAIDKKLRKNCGDFDLTEADILVEFVDQLEDIFYEHGFRVAECVGDDVIIYKYK